MLAEKNARSLADVDELKRQLAELIKDDEKQEAFTGEEKKEVSVCGRRGDAADLTSAVNSQPASRCQLAACVRALEAELTKAVKDAARLEDRNAELARQVSGLEEKVRPSGRKPPALSFQSKLKRIPTVHARVNVASRLFFCAQLMEADSMENHLSHLTEGRKDAAKETRGLRKQLAKFQERVKILFGFLLRTSPTLLILLSISVFFKPCAAGKYPISIPVRSLAQKVIM